MSAVSGRRRFPCPALQNDGFHPYPPDSDARTLYPQNPTDKGNFHGRRVFLRVLCGDKGNFHGGDGPGTDAMHTARIRFSAASARFKVALRNAVQDISYGSKEIAPGEWLGDEGNSLVKDEVRMYGVFGCSRLQRGPGDRAGSS